jgi:hypothetical protein
MLGIGIVLVGYSQMITSVCLTPSIVRDEKMKSIFLEHHHDILVVLIAGQWTVENGKHVIQPKLF